MIVGLVSCYREGRLAADAVRSLLACCEHVRVIDGPIGDSDNSGIPTDWTVFRKDARVTVAEGGKWDSDAAKRSALLAGTRRYPTPTWGLILDGDELLLHGEQIPALIEHHEQEARAKGQTSFGATLRLVEPDNSCGLIMARVLRLDLIEQWLISSYHILLKSGQEISRPNAYFLKAGEPDSAEMESSTGMQIRRPLQGEPHILHRASLRPPQRQAERQSAAEASELEKLVYGAGLTDAHGEKAKDDRVGIWTPR